MRRLLKIQFVVVAMVVGVNWFWPGSPRHLWEMYKATPYKGFFILKIIAGIFVVVVIGSNLLGFIRKNIK